MIVINGTEVLVAKNSLTISDAIEERTTCSFTVVDVDGSFDFIKGENVEVYNFKKNTKWNEEDLTGTWEGEL